MSLCNICIVNNLKFFSGGLGGDIFVPSRWVTFCPMPWATFCPITWSDILSHASFWDVLRITHCQLTFVTSFLRKSFSVKWRVPTSQYFSSLPVREIVKLSTCREHLTSHQFNGFISTPILKSKDKSYRIESALYLKNDYNNLATNFQSICPSSQY